MGSPLFIDADSSRLAAASIRPVVPDTVDRTVNTLFDVFVEVGDVANLFGISFELNFDKTYLNSISETAESFLGNDILFFPQRDNATGKVSFGISKKAGQTGSNGRGNVAKLRFKIIQEALQDTPVSFSISAVTANDSSGNPIILTPDSGAPTLLTEVKEKSDSPFPSIYILYQNHPNPFNPTTMIRYSLPKSGFAALRVYDGLGREVAVLVEGHQGTGVHEVALDAKGMTSGTYYYRLQAGDIVITKRLTMIR